jgi:hypothetical protein
MNRRHSVFCCFLTLALIVLTAIVSHAETTPMTALGVDVDFYTGPISRDVWLQLRTAGQKFAIAQAWGGRSRNEYASAQLAGARTIGGMKTAAYVLLNYDNKVCRTFSKPVRNSSGSCTGDLIDQPKSGARWQVQQGIAALGPEAAHIAFVAIDVEWFLSAEPSKDPRIQSKRRQSILDAIDEVRKLKRRAVIYTRNAKRHWKDITGCDMASPEAACKNLYSTINDSKRPIPLWDVQNGSPELSDFSPYSGWMERAGRQYKLDTSDFGLPPSRTVDLNIFDFSLFALRR